MGSVESHMIYYKTGGRHIILNTFICRGSVFPVTPCIALPSAIFAAVLKVFVPNGLLSSTIGNHWEAFGSDGVMTETTAWGGFSFFVGFLIVFRTSQAFSRFWEGCTSSHACHAEWFDAVSSLVAFTKYSTAPKDQIEDFKQLLIRLASMLHAVAL